MMACKLHAYAVRSDSSAASLCGLLTAFLARDTRRTACAGFLLRSSFRFHAQTPHLPPQI